MVTLEDLRNYLILPPDNNENLEPYLAAARSKARAAGVPNYQNNAQYDLFICALAAMYYENRSMTFSGSNQAAAEENATRMINSFVLGLRYAGEDEEVKEP